MFQDPFKGFPRTFPWKNPECERGLLEKKGEQYSFEAPLRKVWKQE
jgi:hypothetical protein